MTLATIGLVAPDTPFLAMEQVTKHVASCTFAAVATADGSAWSCYLP